MQHIKYEHFRKKVNYKNIFKDIFFIYIIAVVSVLLFNSIFLQAFKIRENSMEPQINENASILVNKFVYGPKYPFFEARIFNATSNIKRGDVIVFMSDDYLKNNTIVRFFSTIVYTLTFTLVDLTNFNKHENTNFFIKRVIGLPNDVIKYKLVDNNIVVFINNIPEKSLINVNYKIIKDNNDKYPLINEYKVKDDEYYILGDNRKVSFDSRIFGGISSKQIIGKAIFKYTLLPPFDKVNIGVIK
jgi:signal peptidase I